MLFVCVVTGPSGAVDEDIFDRSFGQVPVINVSYHIVTICWGLSAGYQPRPQVVDRGTTARYGGQLRYI